MLVRVDDVGAMLEQELRDGGDDAGPIRTRNQQTGDIWGMRRAE
jgi:hypothetical protein